MPSPSTCACAGHSYKTLLRLNQVPVPDALLYSTCSGRRQGGLRGYLSHGSVWLELINNVLLLAAMGLWWCFVNQHAKVFSMDLRYPVRLVS